MVSVTDDSKTWAAITNTKRTRERKRLKKHSRKIVRLDKSDNIRQKERRFALLTNILTKNG